MQLSWAGDWTRKSNRDFVRKIDAMMDADVIWTSYSDEAIT